MIEQRRFQRVPFFCSVTLNRSSDAAPIQCRSFDISLGGVGLATSVRLTVGDMVTMAFSLKDRADKPTVNELMGRVAHVRAESDGNIIGVEFLELLTQAKYPELMRRALRD